MARTYRPRFKLGDYKVRCDQTGAVFNASDCALQWDGLFVYNKVYRPRQPQDLPTVYSDIQRPPNPRPVPGGFALTEYVDFDSAFSTDFNGVIFR